MTNTQKHDVTQASPQAFLVDDGQADAATVFVTAVMADPGLTAKERAIISCLVLLDLVPQAQRLAVLYRGNDAILAAVTKARSRGLIAIDAHGRVRLLAGRAGQ